MKKQKSYHWHFIIAVAILAVIFSALILRENIFYGIGTYIEKNIQKSGEPVEKVTVYCSKYDIIELTGNEIDRFFDGLDYIKVRKLGKFDRIDSLSGKAKYHWIMGSKSFDSTTFPSIKIKFYTKTQMYDLATNKSESLNSSFGHFFIKTPIYMDDILAIAMACKN